MSAQKIETKRFLSLRYKLLIPLMIFTFVMFVMGYFGALAYLKSAVSNAMNEDAGAIIGYMNECLNPDALQTIYDEARTATPEQLKRIMSDPKYLEQEECLDSVGMFFDAWIFTYYPVDENTIGVGVGMSEETEPSGEYSLGYLITAEDDDDFDQYQLGFEDVYIYDAPIYDSTIDSYFYGTTAILTSNGATAGGVAIYLDAEKTIAQMQVLINYLLLIFAVAFLLVIFLIFTIMKKSLAELDMLGAAARRVAEGDYSPIALKPRKADDEVSLLGALFNTMVANVEKREEKLQKQVEQLKIQIDSEKRKKDVDEIVESDFFKGLQERAEQARKQHDQKS